MRLPQPLIIAIVVGLFLTACSAAPDDFTPTSSAAEAASASTPSSVPMTQASGEGLYPPGFDVSAYDPPAHWQAPCKKAYLHMAVGFLVSWNAIRNLLEQDRKLTYRAATLMASYEAITGAPEKEMLRNCRQADPAIGAQFDRGVEAAHTAESIVCHGTEMSSCRGARLSPDERAGLCELIQPLLDAVPVKP